MEGKILLSTAYLPPAEYFSRMLNASKILIENEENYLKQSYRNRCYILAANGVHVLTVPVFLGSLHKTAIKDIRIDYSKRWQQVHLGALNASYRSTPYFEFYFEELERAILRKHSFLLDLNMELLVSVLKILRIGLTPGYTNNFTAPCSTDFDFRYSILPKKKTDYITKEYTRVFNSDKSVCGKLSIADLIFNMGPDSALYL
jgi:hypothetical protein